MWFDVSGQLGYAALEGCHSLWQISKTLWRWPSPVTNSKALHTSGKVFPSRANGRPIANSSVSQWCFSLCRSPSTVATSNAMTSKGSTSHWSYFMRKLQRCFRNKNRGVGRSELKSSSSHQYGSWLRLRAWSLIAFNSEGIVTTGNSSSKKGIFFGVFKANLSRSGNKNLVFPMPVPLDPLHHGDNWWIIASIPQ